MKKSHNLVQHTGKRTYFVRKRVPKALWHYIRPDENKARSERPTRELWRTTETRDLDEACRRRPSILAEFEQEFNEARARAAGLATSASDKQKAAAEWFRTEVARRIRMARDGEITWDELRDGVTDDLLPKLTKEQGYRRDRRTGHPVIPGRDVAHAVDAAAAQLRGGPGG